MKVDAVQLIIVLMLAQAVGALILAGLLRYFYGLFQQRFLLHWTRSTAALALHSACAVAALTLYTSAPEFPWLRLGFSVLSMAAVYPHIAWLMIGTWEAVNTRDFPPRSELWWVAAAALVGAASALVAAFDPEAAWLRNLIRVEIRHLCAGLAFLIAGVLVWRSQHHRSIVGPKLTALGFVLYGAEMLHVAAINRLHALGHAPPAYVPYTGLLDFMFLSVMGLGIVVWLLELQKEHAVLVRSELEHLRGHDPATNLPNRELVLDQIQSMTASPGTTRVAVISLGPARYNELRQALGWQRTEQLMQRLAERLSRAVGHRSVVGRTGERDFVVVRPTLEQADQLRSWCESLLARLNAPYRLDDEEIFATVAAGISLFPEDGDDAGQLLLQSQVALVQAISIGRNVNFYHQLAPQLKRGSGPSPRFETELRRAIEQGQFEMHYQPIIRLDSGHLAGFEALMRWRHPERGLQSPEVFLDAAASIGVLEQLENFAIETALTQLRRWHRRNASGLFVAINLSAQYFQSEHLVDRMREYCHRHFVPPHLLELEITESTALQDLNYSAHTIRRLQQIGIRISLDDFGTGFSSLANLLKLPVDRIKLDRLFIDGIDTSARQRELVASLIGLGRRLGLEVVAEGVEQPEQVHFLKTHNCHFAQGFLFAHPAPASECKTRYTMSS